MVKLDKINCKILNILQKNCRASYTNIAKEVGLSVDSVKKRMDKLLKNEIFYPKVQIRPKNFGYNVVVDVRIKLKDFTKSDLESFISYLKNNPYVVELFTVSGLWNISLVLIAKNTFNLGEITNNIRNKYGNIIQEWSESITTKAYVFETYDMEALVGEK